MTKNSSFKKVVRRHAEQTGQRYTEALSDLEGLGTMHPLPTDCSRIWLSATVSTPLVRPGSACTRPMSSGSTVTMASRGSRVRSHLRAHIGASRAMPRS